MPRLDQQEPTGRVDVAIARALRGIVLTDANPIVQAAYKVLRPELEQVLAKHLGPKSKSARKMSQSAQSVVRLRDEVQRRLAEPL